MTSPTAPVHEGPRLRRVPGYLALRLAAAVLLNRGTLNEYDARDISMARKGGRAVGDAMAQLVEDGLMVRIGDTWYCRNLVDLAAWMADGYADRDEDGAFIDVPVIPAIPEPRSSTGKAA